MSRPKIKIVSKSVATSGQELGHLFQASCESLVEHFGVRAWDPKEAAFEIMNQFQFWSQGKVTKDGYVTDNAAGVAWGLRRQELHPYPMWEYWEGVVYSDFSWAVYKDGVLWKSDFMQ